MFFSSCVVAKATIGINAWSGTKKFIIAHDIASHQVILGKDFLRNNKASIYHGDDSVVACKQRNRNARYSTIKCVIETFERRVQVNGLQLDQDDFIPLDEDLSQVSVAHISFKKKKNKNFEFYFENFS
jgi:hypothetical protein